MFLINLFFILLVVSCLALLYGVVCVVAEGFDIDFFRRDIMKKIKYFFVKLYDSVIEWCKRIYVDVKKAVAGGPKV